MVSTVSSTTTLALAHHVLDTLDVTLRQPVLRANETISNDLQYVQISAQKFTSRLKQAYSSNEPFTDALIHELRGPLSVMVGYLELIQEGMAFGDTLDQRSLNLINNLHTDSLELCDALDRQYTAEHQR